MEEEIDEADYDENLQEEITKKESQVMFFGQQTSKKQQPVYDMCSSEDEDFCNRVDLLHSDDKDKKQPKKQTTMAERKKIHDKLQKRRKQIEA